MTESTGMPDVRKSLEAPKDRAENIKMAMQPENRFNVLFKGDRDHFIRWRRQLVVWKATFDFPDYFCTRYIF